MSPKAYISPGVLLCRADRGRMWKKSGGSVFFFFALCCLGKIPGGAPFSQLHKSGNGSRVDRP